MDHAWYCSNNHTNYSQTNEHLDLRQSQCTLRISILVRRRLSFSNRWLSGSLLRMWANPSTKHWPQGKLRRPAACSGEGWGLDSRWFPNSSRQTWPSPGAGQVTRLDLIPDISFQTLITSWSWRIQAPDGFVGLRPCHPCFWPGV